MNYPEYGLLGVLPDTRKGPKREATGSVYFYKVSQTSGLEDIAMSTYLGLAGTDLSKRDFYPEDA